MSYKRKFLIDVMVSSQSTFYLQMTDNIRFHSTYVFGNLLKISGDMPLMSEKNTFYAYMVDCKILLLA